MAGRDARGYGIDIVSLQRWSCMMLTIYKPLSASQVQTDLERGMRLRGRIIGATCSGWMVFRRSATGGRVDRSRDTEARDGVAGWGFEISASGPEGPARSMRGEQGQRTLGSMTTLQEGNPRGESKGKS